MFIKKNISLSAFSNTNMNVCLLILFFILSDDGIYVSLNKLFAMLKHKPASSQTVVGKIKQHKSLNQISKELGPHVFRLCLASTSTINK